MQVRPGHPDDAEAIRAIYAPIVRTTFTSFETEEPSLDEMRARVGSAATHHPWLVAAEGETVVGYAYAARHRERAAYRWSVDVSIYVHAAFRGRGVGSLLYRELLERVRGHGFVNAFAGIALPNDASVRLHESFGFQPIGIYRNVGYKLGAWRDVGWWQLALREPPMEPTPPV